MLQNLRKSWARLGVAFGETFSSEEWVDVERLILASCLEGRTDSRLFFGMRGWLLKHHDLIMGSRLIRMTKLEKETAMLGALLDSVVSQIPRTNLRYVLKYCKPSPNRDFAFNAIRTSKTLCQLNELENLSVWKRWNLISRDMEAMEGAIAEKSYVLKHNLNLALRALFGAGLRAEILHFFLRFGQGYARQIANRVEQSYEPVYSELRFCQSIGLLKEEKKGREIIYSLRPAILWKILHPLWEL